MLGLYVNGPLMAMQKRKMRVTDADIAAHLRMSAKTVNRWASDKEPRVPVPYPAAILMSEFLQISVDELFEQRNTRAPRSRSDRQVDGITASLLLAKPAKQQQTA